MKPLILGPLACVVLCTPASAQIPASVASGVGSFGGGFRPGTPALTAPVPFTNRFFHRGPFMHGGFVPGHPFAPNPGFGGGFVPVHPFGPFTSFYGGFVPGGYYYPYYDVVPRSSIFDQAPPPPVVAPGPPPRVVELSGESKGTVTLQLPQPAHVWLDGKELDGGPAREWVLASPVLRPGEQYTLHVIARWEVDGQKYESEQKVTVGPGDKSRLGVLSGTAIK